MSTEADIMIQGRQFAQIGGKAASNPHSHGSKHWRWWATGFQATCGVSQHDAFAEGLHHGRNGGWPGLNPYALEPQRTWWQEGFRASRPANDAAPDNNPVPRFAEAVSFQ